MLRKAFILNRHSFLKLHQQRSTMANSFVEDDDVSCKRPFEEITIPVPWGILAGKWYGSREIRPILGLHGWQDNAGTFDTLAPLLPDHIPFLSLDTPGHGLSSHLPRGLAYHQSEDIFILRRVMDYLKWDKISLLGHSMGSMNNTLFSALHPDKVDMLIGLDALKPLVRSPEQFLNDYSKRLEKFGSLASRIDESAEPPAYYWDDLIKLLNSATENSISLESCKYILRRNVKPSLFSPGKYYFSRDARLRVKVNHWYGPELATEIVNRIQCPHLFIKAKGGSFFEEEKHFHDAIEVLRKNPNFSYHVVDGTHHVHLNEPEKVASIINPFILKWRPPPSN